MPQDAKKFTFTEGKNDASTYIKTGPEGNHISFQTHRLHVNSIKEPTCGENEKCTSPAFVSAADKVIASQVVTLPFVSSVG